MRRCTRRRKCLLLIAAEVVTELIAQNSIDFGQDLVDRPILRGRRGAGQHLVEPSAPSHELDELRAHLFRRNREIYEARGDGGLGHVRILRTEAVANLRESNSAALLDRLDAERPVRISA